MYILFSTIYKHVDGFVVVNNMEEMEKQAIFLEKVQSKFRSFYIEPLKN